MPSRVGSEMGIRDRKVLESEEALQTQVNEIIANSLPDYAGTKKQEIQTTETKSEKKKDETSATVSYKQLTQTTTQLV